VISEELPTRTYYKDIPIIQVKNWKEGLRIANKLITDILKLERMSKANKEYYKRNLSIEATAKLIIKTINDGTNNRRL
jgi:hypothetical protein